MNHTVLDPQTDMINVRVMNPDDVVFDFENKTIQ